MYQGAVDRLVGEFLEDSQVVSRKVDGSAEHVGDSLIWTGVAIAVLPCDKAEPIATRLAQRIVDQGGELRRFEPLPQEYVGGREISFDGETGVYFGLARFVRRCNGATRIKPAFALRQSYVDRFEGRLHENSSAFVPDEFTFTRDAISHSLGLRGAPSRDRLLILEQQIAGWLTSVKLAKSACFRANLAWLHIRAIEELGYSISDQGRWAICESQRGLGLAHWSAWCGDAEALDAFVAGFQWNEYEFAHQRCPAWEAPDGKEGLKTPGLDYLFY